MLGALARAAVSHSDQDRAARPEQSHRRQTGMERKAADQRQRQMSLPR